MNTTQIKSKINLILIIFWLKRILLIGLICLVIIKPEKSGKYLSEWINNFFGTITSNSNLMNIELFLVAIILILGYILTLAFITRKK